MKKFNLFRGAYFVCAMMAFSYSVFMTLISQTNWPLLKTVFSKDIYFLFVVLLIFLALVLEKFAPTDQKGLKLTPLFSLVTATALFMAWLFLEPPARIVPDSVTYIRNDAIRGTLYPAFIDLLIPQAIQNLNPFTIQTAYAPVVTVQRFITSAGFMFLGFVLQGFTPLAPLLLVAMITLPHFPTNEMMQFHGSAVMTEGLSYPWLMGLFAMNFIYLRRYGRDPWVGDPWVRDPRVFDSSSLGLFILMGVWGIVGVEIAPRLVPFCLLLFIPFFVEISLRPINQKRILKALAAPFLFALLILLRSSFTYWHAGVFSPIPFNGFNKLQIALQFSQKGDEKWIAEPRVTDPRHYSNGGQARVKDPSLKEFAKQALEDPRLDRTDFTRDFINYNTWIIGWEAYTKVYKEKAWDLKLANKRFADVSNAILSQPDNKRAWMKWYYGVVWKYFTSSDDRIINMAALVSFGLGIILIFKKNAQCAIFLMVPITHLVNILITMRTQGWIPRYTATSELLFYAMPIMIIALLSRKKNEGLHHK